MLVMTAKLDKKRILVVVLVLIAVAVALLRMPVGPDINEHILSEDWGI